MRARLPAATWRSPGATAGRISSLRSGGPAPVIVVALAVLALACGSPVPPASDGAGSGSASDAADAAARTAGAGASGNAGAGAAATDPARPRAGARALVALWEQDAPAFGVFVPDERPREPRQEGAARSGGGRQRERQAPVYTQEGGERLGANPLYDFVFLNLEGRYDPAAVETIAAGLAASGDTAAGAATSSGDSVGDAATGSGDPAAGADSSAAGPTALLVRIPPIERDGVEATRQRVREVLEAGADGVVFPHVRNAEEARQAVAAMTDAGADLWSPATPGGDRIAMIMVEDPGALEQLEEISGVPGIGILACGIGSLTAALDGDREAAEAGNQRVLAAARRLGVADMITAGTDDVAERVEQGFLALLMQGSSADEAIGIGRQAAGR